MTPRNAGFRRLQLRRERGQASLAGPRRTAPSNSRRPAACRAQRAARFAVPPPSAKPTKPCTAERPPSRAAAALAGKSPVRPSAEEAAGADAPTPPSARPAARAEAGSSSRASSNATVMAIARSTGVTSDRPSPYSSQRSASHASNVVTMVPKEGRPPGETEPQPEAGLRPAAEPRPEASSPPPKARAAACAARLRYSTTWPCVGNRTTSYAGAPIGPVASADASMSSLFSLMPSL